MSGTTRYRMCNAIRIIIATEAYQEAIALLKQEYANDALTKEEESDRYDAYIEYKAFVKLQGKFQRFANEATLEDEKAKRRE